MGRRYTRGSLPARLAACMTAMVMSVAGSSVAGRTSTAPLRTAVRIESRPAGALVTLMPDDPGDPRRTVLGLTPIEAVIAIAPNGASRLQVEKRGFEAATVTLDANRAAVSVDLLPTGGPTMIDPGVTEAKILVLVGPELEVIRRGFSSEKVSVDDSAAAADALASAVEDFIGQRLQVRTLPASEIPAAFLRDAQASAKTVDPVRLPFLGQAPRLDTAAGRRAAATVGNGHATRPLLLITGRSSIETAGMKAGKIGIMAAGTAASYGAGYGRAIESGDSTFVYSIYLPAPTGGTSLDAVLVDAATGEILWINRGLYPPLHPDQSDQLAAIVADLLTGLPVGATDTGGSS